MKQSIMLTLTLLCGLAAQAAEVPVKPIKPLKNAASKQLNVVYKVADGTDMLLDYYAPSDKFKGPRPVIFYTHGGGWAVGSKPQSHWTPRDSRVW